MTFSEITKTIDAATQRCEAIWKEAWDAACKKVGGNWQDPDVMRQRREVAYKIADEKTQNIHVEVLWKGEK